MIELVGELASSLDTEMAGSNESFCTQANRRQSCP